MIKAIRGTKDIFGVESPKWAFAESVFRKVSRNFCFEEIRTPIFESTDVFSKSIGETSDIVNKEMYTFLDKGGDSITLRPEETACVIRSVVENSMLQQGNSLRMWYFGPYFRYERPQKGRQRQFHQFGAEFIGSDEPESDAEMIQFACSMLAELGIKEYKLAINSIGDSDSRESYRTALVSYLEQYQEQLSSDSVNRLQNNPLRILDSKDEKDKAIVAGAPSILDYLSESAKARFQEVLKSLDYIGIKYEINNRLVRGLDYYSQTVFEFQSSALGSQDALGGGGRYNHLFERFGAKNVSCVGFAMGVERLLMAIENSGTFNLDQSQADFYFVLAGEGAYNIASKCAKTLREKNYRVYIDAMKKSMKAQFRESNKMGAKYVIIIGDDEIKTNTLTLKDMSNSEQKQISYEDLANL